jgi:hypothetical protein
MLSCSDDDLASYRYQGNYRCDDSNILFHLSVNEPVTDDLDLLEGFDYQYNWGSQREESFHNTIFVTVMELSGNELTVSYTNPFYAETGDRSTDIKLNATVDGQGNLTVQPRTVASISFSFRVYDEGEDVENEEDNILLGTIAGTLNNVTVTYSNTRIVDNKLYMRESYSSGTATITSTRESDGLIREYAATVTGESDFEGILKKD